MKPPRAALTALLVGLAVTGILTWACVSAHESNESRLLNLQVRQAASVVSAAIPSIQIPLASAGVQAASTDGDRDAFVASLGPFTGAKGRFASASLWRLGQSPERVASVGRSSPREIAGLIQGAIEEASTKPGLTVKGDLQGPHPTLIYVDDAARNSTWVVEAEALVPPSRHLKVAKNSAFASLNYALYLGRSPSNADLIGSSLSHPIVGLRASTTVAFGTDAITLVGTPNGELGGNLLALLPWIVAVGGCLLSLLAALTAWHLVLRQRQALVLAEENRALYGEQRGIAETLQRALLPQELPKIDGIDVSARYVAGSTGADIGGDWYDVVICDGNRFVFAIGDVSGRGVKAASTMARLNTAIQAYSLDAQQPSTLLTKVGRFLGPQSDGSFATVLCGVVDIAERQITLVNAGHPPPIVANGTGTRFVQTIVGPPLGVDSNLTYDSTTTSIPRGATFLAFTDGLFERRGETIDVGMKRLLSLVEPNPATLDELLDRLVVHASAEGGDDTAILAIRWTR